MKNILYISILTLCGILGFSSCINDEFDAPTVTQLPNITANATIAQLLAKNTIGSPAKLVEDDLIIKAIVVGDDRTGNIYKNLFVQDATGGIQIRVDKTDFYNTYPVGREVYLRCRGLYIGDYSGTPQLTISQSGGIIPEQSLATYIVAGARNQALPVKTKKIEELTTADLNTLIKFEDVQFISTDAGLPYADAVNQFSLNRTIEDCTKKTIIVRSSGFADFASTNTPTGKGSLTALYTVFGTTKQLVIKDLNDVQLSGERCVASEQLKTIGEVRGYFTGAAGTVPANIRMIGTVISDKDNVNLVGQNLVLQDGDKGIVVRFSDSHPFVTGDRIQVIISGANISEFNGLLQVSGFSTANAEKIGTGSITPRVATVAQVLANLEAWESTLVKINNATLSGGATYSGNRTLNDGTGTISLFTRSQATFSGQSLPTGTVSVTAYVSQFNTAQLNIRNTSDVQ